MLTVLLSEHALFNYDVLVYHKTEKAMRNMESN